MLAVLTIVALIAASQAIVCPPNLCDSVDQKEVNCQGDVIQGGGFCGCSDACAGVDGDRCQTGQGSALPLLGVSPSKPCSSGYECVKVDKGSFLLVTGSDGVCIKKSATTTKRPLSKCEQIRSVRMISFAIWRGQWTPRCNPDGTFEPKQCDNTGACFCVTANEGQVLLGTKKQSQNVSC